MLQSQHPPPDKDNYYTENIDGQDLDSQSTQLRHKPINILNTGDTFGEIGLLTNMKRTCNVAIVSEMCIFQTISKENIEHIEEKFPTLYNHIYDNMFGYNDEDMTQKK